MLSGRVPLHSCVASTNLERKVATQEPHSDRPQPSPIAEQLHGTASTGTRHRPPADNPTGRTYTHSSVHVTPHNQCQPPTSRSLLAIWPERRATPLGPLGDISCWPPPSSWSALPGAWCAWWQRGILPLSYGRRSPDTGVEQVVGEASATMRMCVGTGGGLEAAPSCSQEAGLGSLVWGCPRRGCGGCC